MADSAVKLCIFPILGVEQGARANNLQQKNKYVGGIWAEISADKSVEIALNFCQIMIRTFYDTYRSAILLFCV